MKKINIFLLFLAFSVNLIIADEARSEPKDKHILKWGTIMPAMGVWNETLERIRDMIEEQTGGGIKNIWYYGGVMGDEDDMIRKVRLGQLHGLIILVGGLQKVAPESVVFSLPFFLKNNQEVDCFYSRAWHLVEEVFAKHGYVALGYTHAGSAKLQAKITPNEIRELFQGKRQYIVKDPTEMNKLFKQFKLWLWPVTKEYADYLYRVFPDFGG
ncbi:MAG: TRAP transporter substrate-binding protein DctP, partial [Deltaproteobacteria bacterium]